MKASKLLNSAGLRLEKGFVDFEVRGISCDSRKVGKDFVFVAVKGAKQDGCRFSSQARKNGARLVIEPKDSRTTLARLAASFYGLPSRKLKVVGVTGTNGKTTVTYLIEAILKEARLPAGVIGTVNYRYRGKVISSKNTTPGPVELQGLLSRMKSASVKYCVMEVSSHALDQDRTEGIDFHSAVLTNITQDHLDYHKTIPRYIRAKAKLFKGLSRKAFSIVNIDDKLAFKAAARCRWWVITYVIEHKADVTAKNISGSLGVSEFSALFKGRKIAIVSPLIGRHNIYNILAAVAWALEEGIAVRHIQSAIRKFSLVPGRLERITADDAFSVFVDYAHTEDALSNVLSALRPLCSNRLIVVFGCGGERDRGKRPKMGRVASSGADFAIITNDNPRSEDPRKIIRQIESGITSSNYCVIPDRARAIKKSLSMANEGDVVLIAGKGHENYQILNNRSLHFDDREVASRCLQSMN